MEQTWKKILLGVGMILLLPLGITAGISGISAWKGNLAIDLENYLPIVLCKQIDWGYEEETLKAQAVLARSSLYLCVKNGEISNSLWRNLMREYRENQYLESYEKAYERMERAVEETRGQILIYEGKICEGVFHKVSAGNTRDGVETLKDVSYGYLKSVGSQEDIYAGNYLQGHFFSEKALKIRLKENYPNIMWTEDSIFHQIEILERDSREYVTKMKIGNLKISGEEFRQTLELASSNFSIQEVEGKLRFLCKGLGHGMGLSQFGANEKAREGSTYLEILKYYFPEAEVKIV